MFQVIFLQADPAGGFMSILPILAMIVVLYFFMIRPQMNRQKKEKAFQQENGKRNKSDYFKWYSWEGCGFK